MAFNNINNPRQMFSTQNPGNFSGMQASGHPMGGFQPNQPYGAQGFSPQQGFPGYQMGPPMGPQMGQPMGHQMTPQMGPQMRPHMGPHMQPQIRPQMAPQTNSQMGLQIGGFPSNIQLGHQFPKQQQKVMEQQRKRAEEQLKKQEELMRKKQIEAEKRKLQQSFSAKKPTNADALNNLFGKSKKGGGSSMTDLIGSLGSDTSMKPAASKPSTVFSRPGGSAVHQSNLTPGQWGSGYMTPQGGLATTPAIKQFHGEDDFGDFSQGPSVSDQGDFSDFQGVQSSTQFGGSSPAAVLPNVSGSSSAFSQSQSWQGTPSGPTPSSLTGTQHSFPLMQSTPTASSIHGPQRPDHATSSGTASVASWVGSSSVTQGGQMTHFSGDNIRPQTGSTTGMPMQGGQMTHPIGDSSSPQTGNMSVMSSQFGQMTQFPGNAPTPQTGNMHGMPVQGGQMTHFMGDTPKNRAGSTSEVMPNFGGNAPSGGTMPQPGTPHSHLMRNVGGGNVPVGALPPTMGPQESGFGLRPSYPGTVPSPREEPNTQQALDGSRSSAVAPEPTQEPVLEDEDSPERKLELLYGVTLPDWCVNGTDLPGVYKEIAEKTTDASDAIDTNRLFPILMASDLPRDQLGHVWNKANRAVPGQLNTLELRIVLGLVALAQAGLKTERLTLEKLASCKAAPIPTIPEHVLETRGRGWSFTEPSQEGTQSSGIIEGDVSRGRQSSTSSDHSIDPNDKYSVFRAVEQPEVAAVASSPSVDSKDRFGAFQSGDQHVLQPMSQPSQLPLLHSGVSQSNSSWNQTEVSSMGGSNLSSQQQTFGHFQTVTSQGMNEDEFGDFRGQTALGDNSGPSKLGQKISQDDFGDFQSEATLHENTTSVANQTSSQVKVPDVRSFQLGTDWGSGASPAFKATDIAVTIPQEDDFGDFQGGKEPETGHFTPSSVKEPKNQDQVQPVQEFGNFQTGNKSDKKTKSSESAGVDLFSKSVNNTTTNSVENVDTSGLKGADDFGDFQHSPGPLSTTNKGFASFGSSGSEKLVSSLEKFKLSNNAFSLPQGGLTPSSITGKSSTNEKQPTDTSKQNVFGDFSASGNIAPPPSNQAETSEDRYSALRDADWGSEGGLFTVQEPVTTDDQIKDDGFADFGGFEVAEQFKSGDDNDFGAFKSTDDVQSASFGVASDSQPAQQSFNPDFGDFSSSVSTNLSAPQPKTDSNGGFGAFGSFVTTPSTVSSNQPHPTSNASGSLINSVSLEPTERYKVLSHDSVNMDQHAHAWSRCLNSCLLTLATATLAIQKIGEQSVKKEVLESKEGATYFSAIVEIYRVTLRIKASISKTAPNNTKLKDIQQEIERTWKDVSSFLTGSDILPSRSSLDFTLHHVPASEDGSVACGICLLNVNKNTPGSSKNGDGKLMYGGRHYHSTCANFWCNRVDSVLPSLLPIDSLI